MHMVSNRPVTDHSGVAAFTNQPLQAKSGSQGLEDVIKQLVQALLKAGNNDDSGLGQMVKDKMPGGLAGGSGGGAEQLLSKILEQLIGEKLGKDFGQSPAGGGGGGVGGCGGKPDSAPGLGHAGGGSDLLERVLSGLAKSSMDGMLKPDGEGTRFEQKDAGMMQEVAKFMDAHPQRFPAPDAGSWGKELIEDKYLNQSETNMFKSAMAMIGTQLDGKTAGQVPGGATPPGQHSLGGAGGLGSPSGNPGLGEGDILKELTKLLGGVVDGLQNLSGQLGLGNVEQGAKKAADAIVSLMLPGAKQSV